jgi:hypothetical protein
MFNVLSCELDSLVLLCNEGNIFVVDIANLCAVLFRVDSDIAVNGVSVKLGLVNTFELMDSFSLFKASVHLFEIVTIALGASSNNLDSLQVAEDAAHGKSLSDCFGPDKAEAVDRFDNCCKGEG